MQELKVGDWVRDSRQGMKNPIVQWHLIQKDPDALSFNCPDVCYRIKQQPKHELEILQQTYQLGEQMKPEIKVGSHWSFKMDNTDVATILKADSENVTFSTKEATDSSVDPKWFLYNYKPRPDLDCSLEPTEFKTNISVNTKKWIDYMFRLGYKCTNKPDITFDYMYVNTKTKKFELSYDQIKFANSPLPHRTVYEIVEPQPTTKEQPMNKLDLRLLTAIMAALATAEDEQLDATNSNSVVIVTKEGEYEGYFYANDIETIQKIIQEPKNELKKFHVFDYSNTFAQKPRKIIEVERS